MDLLQLKYFQVVAKYEHMAHAAEELHIAQPTLSKAISRLEGDLGVYLFDRRGRKIRLNEFGTVFLARVNRIFTELEEGKQELADMAEYQCLNISVALNIPSLLPYLLKGFLSKYPKLNLRTEIGSTNEMKNKLEDSTVDFCISSPPITGENIESVPLLTEEIFLNVPEGHRLADRKEIDLCEATGESFITFKKDYGIRNLTESFCRQAGFAPNIVYEGDITDSLTDLVNIGLGVALLPATHHWSPALINPPIYVHIRRPVCERAIGISYVRDRYLPKAARKFKDYVIEYFEEINMTGL